MRAIFVAILLLPALCFALSAESEYFLGTDGYGNEVLIEFESDGFAWNGNRFVYSDRKNLNFKYCWGSMEADFQCTSKENTKPTVKFRALQEYKTNSSAYEYTPEFKAALEIFQKNHRWVKEYGSPMGILKCEIGCTKEIPQFLFNAIHIDGD